MPTKSDIFNEIKELINNGSSITQAISVVCQQYHINPNIIYNEFYKKADKTVKDNSIRPEEIRVGDIVTLNGDSLENHYEVININNKSDIILRNADDNTQISASESEITPVITENKMNKLNEAQYNISINGLETEDADALSQMLSLASQAENSSTISDPMLADPLSMGGMANEPMMNDTGMEEPTEPEESMDSMEIGMPSSIFDDSGDDINFDEELPNDTEIVDAEVSDAGMEEPMNDMEMSDDMDIPAEDMSMDDMMDNGMYDEVDEDVVLDPAQKDSTAVASEKINDFDKYPDNELDEELEMLMRETFDIAGVEDLNFDKLNESEENVPGDDFIDDDGTLEETPQLDFAHDMVDDSEQEENAEEIVGEADGDDMLRTNEAYEEAYEIWNNSGSDENDLYGICQDVAEKYEVDADVIYNNIMQVEKDSIYDNELDEAEEIVGDNEEIAELYDVISDQMGEEFFSDEEDDGYRIRDAIIDFGREILDNFDEDKVDEYYTKLKQMYNEKNKVIVDDELNEHINAILRNAGVQINEADDDVAVNTNVGEPVTDESLFANDDENEQGNEPDYHEVDTTTFGKEASEGMKENPLTMTFESTINKKKIKSIYETAKSMYKKYDANDWLKLDRRYIEKLILEGVGYSTASKMLLDAKKGK